ncbi:galactosylceramide sulfotransferase-like [Saccoglossus kowalevskii]|uniref:Galactosylceramide sulfotransferase-like n=1 Tax=Saccoglossus kowalevskii TaxID=10224 RepID=A0ABM0M1F7_SACKO|nr:PREDICTED: galactosylceramide sulfotransferase-like [Saccoglossus kowalevskii]
MSLLLIATILTLYSRFTPGPLPFNVSRDSRWFTTQPSPITPSTCQPAENMVFIKTHKTGSTSLHCIFCRYGYANKLSFVFSTRNTKDGHIRKEHLNQSIILPPIGGFVNSSSKYNILTGHVSYKRKTINSFMEDNPIYVTILREPATHVESHMNFFSQRKQVMASMQAFLKKPRTSKNEAGRNNQLREFGLSFESTLNERIVNETIMTLDKEFDLVLILEYFDESLILLKHLLCWSFEDIIYLAQNQRTTRETITDTFRHNVYRWSNADYLFYNYFNRTLWEKIRQFGPRFEIELAHFRDLLKEHSKQMAL